MKITIMNEHSFIFMYLKGNEGGKPWLKSYPEEIPSTVSYDIQPLHRYVEQMASLPRKESASLLEGYYVFGLP